MSNPKRSQLHALLQPEVLSDGSSIRVARAKSSTGAIEQEFRKPVNQSKARSSALIYAESRLVAWRDWARDNRGTLGYPTRSLLYQAMQSSKVGVIRGTAHPEERVEDDGQRVVHYPINADGKETRSSRPVELIGDPPAEIIEVDMIVARLPADLKQVIIADYFTPGPIEVRCKKTRWRRARFFQLLESAKYAVFVQLQSSDLRLDGNP